MTFNINDKYSIDGKTKQLARIILSQDADIVFLAEDFEGVRNELDSLLKRHYPYTTIQDDKQGHYFYSMHPIDSTYRVKVKKGHSSRIYLAVFDLFGRKVKVYGVHFESNNYTESKEYFSHDSIKSALQKNDYFGNIERASDFRCVGVDSLIADYGREPFPSLIIGDFNDVGGSPMMRKLEVYGMKEAWWEGGFGYGETIRHLLPYRIDHVMHTEGLKCTSVKVIKQDCSDHDALLASFEIE